MARARNIKPGFFKNEDLAECSPWARLCFAGLWTLADREGRLEDRPKRIKGELFAFDSIEAEPLLVELERQGFIHRYKAPDGRGVIQVLAFDKHQNPHHREPPSDLPPPESPGLLSDATPPKPEALPALQPPEAQGKAEASPGLCREESDKHDGKAGLIPESGTLIPDSGGKTARKRASPPECPAGVDGQVWSDWLELRHRKAAPVTQTVIDGAATEAKAAGMTLEAFLRVWCVRGSQGLQAEWLKPHERIQAPQQSAEPAWRTEQRERNEAFLGPAAAKRRTTEPETIDATARLLG